MTRRTTWATLLRRSALVVPVTLLLAGCNAWPMYGGDSTHANDDPSGVLTTGTAPGLTEAGTTAAVTGTNAWVTSSPTVSANGLLYVTANAAAPKTCLTIPDPNDFPGPDGFPGDVQPASAPNQCATTGGALYAYPAAGGTTNCPTPTGGHPTLNCAPVWTAVPSATHGVTTAPAVDTSLSTPTVYVGTHGGQLYAYNAATGALLWQSQTLGGSIDGSLTIAGGNVYVPEDYGWVYVFPSTTGTSGNDQNCFHTKGVSALECGPDWGYATGGNNFSTPAVANGMLIQAAGDHVGNGQNKNDPNQYAVYGFNASYVAGQCPGTFAPHESGLPLSAIATCLPAWSAPYQYGGGWDGGGSSPAVADGDVYIESHSNGLLAYSASGTTDCTGTPYTGQWGELCTPLWAGSTGKDYAGGADIGPTPAVAGGSVYIGNRAGTVYAFNASTGAVEWSAGTGGSIDSSVVVSGDSASDSVVLVGCTDSVAGQTCRHSLSAFNASTGGTPLWTADTGGSVDDPPIVADDGSGSGTGAVYVASGAQVFAFGLPTSH